MPTAQPTQPTVDLAQLRDEHAALEARLHELERQRSLSPEERYEILVIKKRKLALKDLLTHPE
jgi:hypothetical protein